MAQFRRWRKDKKPADAPMISLKWFRLRNWLRFSRKGDECCTRRPSSLGLFCIAAPLAGGILVRIGRFLRRPHFRHVAQVDADAGPGRRTASHRVDEHVIHRQHRRYPGVFRLPPFEPCRAAALSGEFATMMSGILTRCFFAADFAREGATRGASPSILRKCGGHGASPSPAASSLPAISSNLSSEPGFSSMSACGSPIFANRCGHCEDREIRRIAVRHFVPVERSRNAGVG